LTRHVNWIVFINKHKEVNHYERVDCGSRSKIGKLHLKHYILDIQIKAGCIIPMVRCFI